MTPATRPRTASEIGASLVGTRWVRYGRTDPPTAGNPVNVSQPGRLVTLGLRDATFTFWVGPSLSWGQHSYMGTLLRRGFTLLARRDDHHGALTIIEHGL
jgi:hypothetical protein